MLFLMDTHGLFDCDWDMNYNKTIATFTTLISSSQIYNIKHQISGDVLDTLEVSFKICIQAIATILLALLLNLYTNCLFILLSVLVCKL